MTPETLDLLSFLADMAYSDHFMATSPGLRNVLSDQKGPRGFVLGTAAGTVVSIRGTASVWDAVQDVKFFKALFLKRFLVHTGCFEEYQAVYNEIAPYLDRTKPVFLTGHSLGGGIASLLALGLREDLRIDLSGATFGSLRTMDPESAEQFDREIPDWVRVVHAWDIVPRVPKIEYAHVGRELHLTSRGRVIGASKAVGWLDRWLVELWMAWRDVKEDLRGTAEKNHHMKTYVRCVRGWVARQQRKEIPA